MTKKWCFDMLHLSWPGPVELVCNHCVCRSGIEVINAKLAIRLQWFYGVDLSGMCSACAASASHREQDEICRLAKVLSQKANTPCGSPASSQSPGGDGAASASVEPAAAAVMASPPVVLTVGQRIDIEPAMSMMAASKDRVVDEVDTSKVSSWGVAVVGQWLASEGLAEFQAKFAAEDIDGEALVLLTESDLEILGLSIGRKRKLLKHIEALKRYELEAAPSSAASSIEQQVSAGGPPTMSPAKRCLDGHSEATPKKLMRESTDEGINDATVKEINRALFNSD